MGFTFTKQPNSNEKVGIILFYIYYIKSNSVSFTVNVIEMPLTLKFIWTNAMVKSNYLKL